MAAFIILTSLAAQTLPSLSVCVEPSNAYTFNNVQECKRNGIICKSGRVQSTANLRREENKYKRDSDCKMCRKEVPCRTGSFCGCPTQTTIPV